MQTLPRIVNMQKLPMGEAYDFTQYSGISHGDIMLVRDGIAIMYLAWPTMYNGNSKVFHETISGFDDLIANIEANPKRKPEQAIKLRAAVSIAKLSIDELKKQSIDYTELLQGE